MQHSNEVVKNNKGKDYRRKHKALDEDSNYQGRVDKSRKHNKHYTKPTNKDAA